MSSTCPVCYYPLDNVSPVCPQCHWALTGYISLSSDDELIYHQRITEAQQAWQQHQAQQKPAFSREEGESFYHYQHRLQQQRYYVGTAQCQRYHAHQHCLYLTIEWQAYFKLIKKGYYCYLSVDDQYQESAEQASYALYADLDVSATQGVYIKKLYIYLGQTVYSVYDPIDDQYWQWAQNQHTPEAYQQYLHHLGIQSYTDAAHQGMAAVDEAQKKEQYSYYIIMILLATVGSGIGAIIGFNTLKHFLGTVLSGGAGAITALLCAALVHWLKNSLDRLEHDTFFALEMVNGEKVDYYQQPPAIDGNHDLYISGWAVDKIAMTTASAVHILWDEDEIIACYGLSRQDVAESLNQLQYESSGFSICLPAQYLTEGTHELGLKIINHAGSGYYSPEKTLTVQVTRT